MGRIIKRYGNARVVMELHFGVYDEASAKWLELLEAEAIARGVK